MKRPTKVALENIAKEMVDSDIYINTRGSVNFITEAVRIHKSMDSMVSAQTIKIHQQELEQMCAAEMLKRYPLKTGVVVPNQFDDDYFENDYKVCEADIKLYDELGEEVDDSKIISIAMSKIERIELGEQKLSNHLPIKEYSMFIESEDGLRVIRGTYKGKYVYEIDHENFVGCAAGWSRFCMSQNEQLGAERKGALTEDDKNVFLDIISGREV